MRLKFQPGGSNSSMEAQIPASRLKSQPQGSNPSLKAQICTHGWTDGQTDEQTNKSPSVFYRTSSTLGWLPCYLSPTITNIHSRATGIADHILPLGDWLLNSSVEMLKYLLLKQVKAKQTSDVKRTSVSFHKTRSFLSKSKFNAI